LVVCVALLAGCGEQEFSDQQGAEPSRSGGFQEVTLSLEDSEVLLRALTQAEVDEELWALDSTSAESSARVDRSALKTCLERTIRVESSNSSIIGGPITPVVAPGGVVVHRLSAGNGEVSVLLQADVAVEQITYGGRPLDWVTAGAGSWLLGVGSDINAAEALPDERLLAVLAADGSDVPVRTGGFCADP
jgi:hypothetical protein